MSRVLTSFSVICFLACGGGGGTALEGLDVPQDQEIDADVQGPAEDVGAGVEQDIVTEQGEGAAQPACEEGEPCDDHDPCTFGEKCIGGVCTGGTQYFCDDGRECTQDLCDGLGNCSFVLKAGTCLIAGVCYQDGDEAPDNPCTKCAPEVDAAKWTPSDDGKACVPQLDLCTEAKGGVCNAGKCSPVDASPVSCEDNNLCTNDYCDPAKGCVYEPLSGIECFLDSACEPGVCVEGKCVVPQWASCDDGNPCTADICDVDGCKNVSLSGVPCDDGSVCTLDDVCIDGECIGAPLNCNDGNICTLDGCHPVTGCFHDIQDNACCEGGVSICDDGDVCTDDGCDPVTLECFHVYNEAACDDKDPCTKQDKCQQGKCIGIQIDCNDNNPCTLDFCQAGTCVNQPLSGVPCDDGLECSVGDHCVDGECVADKSQCVCEPTFSQTVNKFTKMSIASTGYPGDGLNVDENPATCAPSGSCSGGIDNALGPIASIGNQDIQKSLDKGEVLVLLEHKGFRTDGKPYVLAVYAARKLDPSNPNCNVQTDVCKYLVDKASFDDDCNPLVSFDNAKIVGNKLTAGGKGYVFPFELPLIGSATLTLTLYFARVEAEVTVVGSQIVYIKGILAGAVPKQQIKDAIMALPPEVELPLPKEQIIALIDALVQADIDGDGDGKKESASIGIKFEGIAGYITGVF